jgi:hypothetical protein
LTSSLVDLGLSLNTPPFRRPALFLFPPHEPGLGFIRNRPPNFFHYKPTSSSCTTLPPRLPLSFASRLFHMKRQRLKSAPTQMTCLSILLCWFFREKNESFQNKNGRNTAKNGVFHRIRHLYRRVDKTRYPQNLLILRVILSGRILYFIKILRLAQPILDDISIGYFMQAQHRRLTSHRYHLKLIGPGRLSRSLIKRGGAN